MSYFRFCTGSVHDPVPNEPASTGWLHDDISVSENECSIVKLFNFTLKDDSPIEPRTICPAEALAFEGLPKIGDTITSDTMDSIFYYSGNGTLVHPDEDSRFWQYRAEYSSSKQGVASSSRRTELPWKQKPTNISITFPEIVKPFKLAYDYKNKIYEDSGASFTETKTEIIGEATQIVSNTAGDPFDAKTKRNIVQLHFTYNIKPRDFDINELLLLQNSVNSRDTKIIGLNIEAGTGCILSISPVYHDESLGENSKRKYQWWEITVDIQIDKVEKRFGQKFLNTGNRAKFPSPKSFEVTQNGVVRYLEDAKNHLSDTAQQIYQWFSFDGTSGQAWQSAKMQFGNKHMLAMAKKQYDIYKKQTSDTLPEFTYEASQNIPLDKHGMIDTNAIEDKEYKVLFFGEYPTRNWNLMDFPTRGVDW